MDSFSPVYNESHIQIKLPLKLIPTGPEKQYFSEYNHVCKGLED